MSDVKGVEGEVRFTLSITRKETGLAESYEMVGHVVSCEPPVVEEITYPEGEPECPQP